MLEMTGFKQRIETNIGSNIDIKVLVRAIEDAKSNAVFNCLVMKGQSVSSEQFEEVVTQCVERIRREDGAKLDFGRV